MMRLAAVLAWAAVTLVAAPAAAERVYDLGSEAPVAGHKTWHDLLTQLFSDLRQEPQKDGKMGSVIHGNVDLRPIDKDGYGDCGAGGPLQIEYLEYAYAEISGKARLIVGITTDHGACFGALALFDALEVKLLDTANIQQDTHYTYGPDFARRLGVDGQLVVADSFHLNSDGSFNNLVLVLVTADKLSLIDNVNADSEWDCDHHRRIAEEPYVVVTPDYGRFDRITGYIKRTVEPVGGDCRTPTGNPKVTISRTDWRWDAVRKAYGKVSP